MSNATTVVVPYPPQEVIQHMSVAVLRFRPGMGSIPGQGVVTFSYQVHPAWAIVLGILLLIPFLIGIVFFFIKETRSFTVSALPAPNGSQVTISGQLVDGWSQRIVAMMTANPPAQSPPSNLPPSNLPPPP